MPVTWTQFKCDVEEMCKLFSTCTLVACLGFAALQKTGHKIISFPETVSILIKTCNIANCAMIRCFCHVYANFVLSMHDQCKRSAFLAIQLFSSC